MKKNDIFTAEIEAVSAEGNGICRIDGFAVFVSGGAVGDVAEIRIVKMLKNYAFGRLERLITPSPYRTDPICPCFQRCGGCVYRHISYEEELRIKHRRVADAVGRIGGFRDFPIDPIVGAERTDGYRNKAQLPVSLGKNGVEIGFFANHSHRITDTDRCLLQPEIFNKALKIFREFLNQTDNPPYIESEHKGVVRHLYLRLGEKTGELMVCPVINADCLNDEDRLVEMLRAGLPGLKTVVINTNTKRTNVILGEKNRTVLGGGYIEDELCGCRFRISPLSFYQVNRTQAEKLYTLCAEYADLSENDTLLDLYCGTGTIGLTMASRCKRLIGAEIVEQAVADARINAKINGIENAEFICADAAQAAQRLALKSVSPDVVIIDPPRKGCSAELIETIAKMLPKRVVYVSCDPATLARDLSRFAALPDGMSYLPVKITPLDMFPRTAHVECVVLMSKVQK